MCDDRHALSEVDPGVGGGSAWGNLKHSVLVLIPAHPDLRFKNTGSASDSIECLCSPHSVEVKDITPVNKHGKN